MNRLLVDTLRSVGLVKDGDDPEAKVMLFKSATPTPDDKGMISKDELPPSGPTMAKETAVAELDLAAIEDEGVRTAVSERIAKLEADLVAATASEEPTEVDVVKEASPEVQALLKAQADELAEAREEIAKEREARLDREAIAKAEALPMVGDHDQLVGILKAATPALSEQLVEFLGALNERLEMSNLFKQVGVTDSADADPIDRRDAFVKEYRKDNPEANVITARRAFWQAFPELKEESRKDN